MFGRIAYWIYRNPLDFFIPWMLIVGICGTIPGYLFLNQHQIPAPSGCFYVNDFMKVLSYDTENYILREAKELEHKTGYQVVVLTVDYDTESHFSHNYNRLFDVWNIGDKSRKAVVISAVFSSGPESDSLLLAQKNALSPGEITEKISKLRWSSVHLNQDSRVRNIINRNITDEILYKYAHKEDVSRINNTVTNVFVATAQEIYKSQNITPPESLAFTGENHVADGTVSTADSDYIEDPLKGLSVDRLLSFEYLLAGSFIALMSWLITVMIIGYKIGMMVKNNEINDLSDSERKRMDYFFNKRKNW